MDAYTSTLATMQSRALKVVMVEDNEFFAHLVSLSLQEEHGYQVRVHYSGEDFFLNWKENPDVVLLDYQLNSANLNHMNGDEVLKRIIKLSPATKVVMISSQEDMERAIGMLKHGACNYICKDPNSIENIAKTLGDIEQLIFLSDEIKTLREKSRKERKRLFAVLGVLLLALVASFYLG